jgi:hypothetical protein
MRIDQIAHEIGLGADELRRFSSISVDVIRQFKQVIDRERDSLPIWSGRPRYGDLENVNRIICEVKNPMGDFGAASHRQLTFFMERLRNTGNMRDFFGWYGEQSRQNGMQFDVVFKFLRACEYGLVEYYALIEALANSISTPHADYSYFLAEMSNLFRPECVKALDERGIPMQISERVYQADDTIDTLSARLFTVAASGAPMMTPFERQWVLEVLAT